MKTVVRSLVAFRIAVDCWCLNFPIKVALRITISCIHTLTSTPLACTPSTSTPASSSQPAHYSQDLFSQIPLTPFHAMIKIQHTPKPPQHIKPLRPSYSCFTDHHFYAFIFLQKIINAPLHCSVNNAFPHLLENHNHRLMSNPHIYTHTSTRLYLNSSHSLPHISTPFIAKKDHLKEITPHSSKIRKETMMQQQAFAGPLSSKT